MSQAGITLNPDGTVSVTAHFDVGDLPTAFQPKTEAQLQADADAALAAAQQAAADAQTVTDDVAATEPPPAAQDATSAPPGDGSATADSSPPAAPTA